MQNETLVDEVIKTAKMLKAGTGEPGNRITLAESLQVAIKIQQNRILSAAFLQGPGLPSVLKEIANGLGAGENGLSVTSALYEVADKIQNHE